MSQALILSSFPAKTIWLLNHITHITWFQKITKPIILILIFDFIICFNLEQHDKMGEIIIVSSLHCLPMPLFKTSANDVSININQFTRLL